LNNFLDNKIELIKDTHTYRLLADPEIEFTSVTTLIHTLFEPFDEVAIADNLCATNPKYMGMEPNELISKWHAARDHGSKVHEEIELALKKGIAPSEPKAKIALQWLDNYAMKSNIEIFSEVILYSTDLKIAGTIDILAYDKVHDHYEIIDWKTSKKINIVSYGSKMGIHPTTANIMDCNHNHYAMQLSLYRYLLESYYGAKVHIQMIGHLKDDKCTSYITPYFYEQISSIAPQLT
jgi:ATP-dependent exoDNAse (exonuclease V) beta subunit|tara:strand:- start:597 stop:1304 length:708 start_codon:yes stop_codon:yes gene_type:complete